MSICMDLTATGGTASIAAGVMEKDVKAVTTMATIIIRGVVKSMNMRPAEGRAITGAGQPEVPMTQTGPTDNNR